MALGQKDNMATSFLPSYKQDILLHHESYRSYLFTLVSSVWMGSEMGELWCSTHGILCWFSPTGKEHDSSCRIFEGEGELLFHIDLCFLHHRFIFSSTAKTPKAGECRTPYQLLSGEVWGENQVSHSQGGLSRWICGWRRPACALG